MTSAYNSAYGPRMEVYLKNIYVFLRMTFAYGFRVWPKFGFENPNGPKIDFEKPSGTKLGSVNPSGLSNLSVITSGPKVRLVNPSGPKNQFVHSSFLKIGV